MARTLMSDAELIEILSESHSATAVHVGEDARVRFANKAMLQIWDKQEIVMDKPLIEYLPELKGQPFIAMLAKVWKDGQTISGVDTPAQLMVAGELKTFYFDFEYRAIKKSNGQISCVLHSAIDVTERLLKRQALENAHRSEMELMREQAINEELAAANEELNATNEELQESQSNLAKLNLELEERVEERVRAHSESEERFRIMAELSGILIAVSDESGNAIYFSRAWTEFVGRDIKDLLDYGWLDMLHEDDRAHFLASYQSSFAKRVPFAQEARMLSHTGEHRWILVNSQPRFSYPGVFEGYISCSIDITDFKKDEERKNDFIGMVSHELKTPLTSLSGYIQMMHKRAIKADDSFSIGALETAKRQVQKMTSMIDGFLTISRLESGKIVLTKSTFNINELVEDTISEIRLIDTRYHVSYTFDRDYSVTADYDKVGNVISNLVNNAMKYSPHNMDIEVSCKLDNDMVQLSIKDYGFGIKDIDRDNLFQRYYRVEGNPTISGFGIGLYLSAEIVHRHGGEIWVESEFGKGSTFYFTLPVDKTSTDLIQGHEKT